MSPKKEKQYTKLSKGKKRTQRERKNVLLVHTLNDTRKYPLRGYILGVLTHTTAWDRHWKGDETLKLVLVYVA